MRVFWAFAAVTWAAAWLVGARRPEPDLYPFLKRAFPGARYEPKGAGRFEVRRDGALAGYVATGTDYGYGGSMTVAVALDPGGRILSLAVLEYRDTPDLFARAHTVLRRLLGKRHSDPFRLGLDVDAVSGATYSSRGLVNAAMTGARRIAERVPLGPTGGSRPEVGLPEAVAVALLAVAIAARHRPSVRPPVRRALRGLALVGGLAGLGFAFDRPWVIGFPIRLLAGDWPAWHSHLYWYLLLASVVLTFDRTGQSPYCPWMCPFGSAQDAMGLLGGARRRRLRAPVLFAWTKRGLLWLAVLLGLLYRTPGAASYEVFGALFRWAGSSWQFAVLFASLAAAIVVRRPFCHWVCPVDAVEQALRPLRRRLVAPGGVASRRPVIALKLLPAEPRPAGLDSIERFRARALAAVGVVCAFLVLGHLGERFSAQARGEQENMVSRTFVTRSEEPKRPE